jgi:hypothetical protein
LKVRYERRADIHQAFLSLGCAGLLELLTTVLSGALSLSIPFLEDTSCPGLVAALTSILFSSVPLREDLADIVNTFRFLDRLQGAARLPGVEIPEGTGHLIAGAEHYLRRYSDSAKAPNSSRFQPLHP